ncbi:hypothetical protein [Streptomyces sp. LaPpAH-108]|uniref:hypothetical protein n=1 Tax=Streptomyces sp. LaPpAH-108 TaxID=1155714 RepID=UPI000687ED7F|nr:hypothetical protein [Streptomyces sp. LaPpAH-108]
MTYRRALFPAAVGAVLVTLVLWWAGASAQALRLPGAGTMLDPETAAQLRQLLMPWSYDPPSGMLSGGEYVSLYRAAMQIRYVMVFVLFVAGAVFLLRALPPARGRATATLLAVWTWSLAAGTLATAVSAPWLLASRGRGSFRLLPQLSGVIASGAQVTVVAGLLAAAGTVVVARINTEDVDEPVRRDVPRHAARLSASVGTAVVAVSVIVLSYQSVAAAIQTSPYGTGYLSEPGELLRQWLLLGFWTPPTSTALTDWLLFRLLDALLLVVVWWSLRLLPGLLTRVTVPVMALCGVCATVLGLLVSQLGRIPLTGDVAGWGPLYLLGRLGGGVPAAVTFGTAAGVAAAVVWRVAGGTVDPAEVPVAAKAPESTEGAAEA